MIDDRGRYVLNADIAEVALRAKGYRSFNELARTLGLHRNTLNNYLTGAAPFPAALERILAALELTPQQAFRDARPQRKITALAIAPLVGRLCAARPDSALVLFGSRARGRGKRYSDYDLGIYREPEIEFGELSRLLDQVDEWNAAELTTAQLTNLSAGGEDFLRGVREDVQFLGGNFLQWLALLRKAGVQTYE